jgi:hypothetical protein
MALGAVLAAALTDHSAHAKSLWLAGVDVLKGGGTNGSRFGVGIETIEIEEQGPGGVSGLTFTLDDPQLALLPAAGDWTVLWDHVQDRADFAGWVLTPTIRDLGLGRAIDVRCIGVETILDWSVCPAMTFDGTLPGGWTSVQAIQAIVGQASWGAPGIRAIAAAAGFGTADQPLGIMGNGFWTDLFTIGAGKSVRQAIDLVLDHSRPSLIGDEAGASLLVTVDWQLGLRGWEQRTGHPEDVPADYADLDVVSSAGSLLAPGMLRHTIDGGGIVRGILVVGTGGTWSFQDGTGLPGPVQVIEDSTVTTAAAARALAAGTLGPATARAQGTYVLEDWAPTLDVKAGSRTRITDTQVGLANAGYRVMGVTKTYNPSGRETWRVTYGALPPSLVDSIGR